MIADFLSRIYHFTRPTKYLINLIVIWPFLVIDQLLNALTGGSPRETISGRLNRHRNGLGRHLVNALEWIDKDHCKEWEAPNAVREEVFNWW